MLRPFDRCRTFVTIPRSRNRPTLDEDHWPLGEWQVQTYAWGLFHMLPLSAQAGPLRPQARTSDTKSLRA